MSSFVLAAAVAFLLCTMAAAAGPESLRVVEPVVCDAGSNLLVRSHEYHYTGLGRHGTTFDVVCVTATGAEESASLPLAVSCVFALCFVPTFALAFPIAWMRRRRHA